MTDHLAELAAAGVSIWLDDLSRSGCRPGTSRRSSRTSTSPGVTTNPSIFAAALARLRL